MNRKLSGTEWVKQAVRMVLYPPIWVTVLASLASAALLTAVFFLGLEETPLAYAAYPLSAWALTAAVLRLIPLVRDASGRIRRIRWLRPILEDQALRARVSVQAGLGISLFYAAFKFVVGWTYQSNWFMSTAAYYTVLALMRYLLLRGVKGAGAERADTAWLVYRAIGLMMLVLTAAISAMAVQMVIDNQAYAYPGVIIYASAAYTFYSLSVAAVNLVRYRREENPLSAAARVLTFASALMAIFALQSGMIARFGEGDEIFRLTMNALTGGAVCLAVLGMGIMMVVRASREISRLRRGRAERE